MEWKDKISEYLKSIGYEYLWESDGLVSYRDDRGLVYLEGINRLKTSIKILEEFKNCKHKSLRLKKGTLYCENCKESFENMSVSEIVKGD